jgi:hypothetical protein
MPALDRYQLNLQNARPPGTGCHGWIMSTANFGIMAGKDPDAIFTDLRKTIPAGDRRIPDKEIEQAIDRAVKDIRSGAFIPKPRPKPTVSDGTVALRKIIDSSKISDEVDIWECSPIRLHDEPKRDMILFFEAIYNDDDLLTIRPPIGPGILGKSIRSVKEWKEFYPKGGTTEEHIIPAPMTGEPGLNKDGQPSLQCVCVVEFDELSREDQLRFWAAVKLPVLALIDSGGKSIHGLLDVQKLASVQTPADWKTHIEGHLYNKLLVPMGVDGHCKNPSRLSRLPGHYRKEKQAWQRLLWLSPTGRPIC